MLGKLIKHEWKATWKVPALFCLFIILTCAILTSTLCLFDNAWDYQKYGTIQSKMPINFYLMVHTALFFTHIVTAFYFTYRFYQNLFTKEGYLMHTLPVTAGQLILSKIICAVFWCFFTAMLSRACQFVINHVQDNHKFVFYDLPDALPDIQNMCQVYAGTSLGFVLLFKGTHIFVECLSYILIPYLCFSLGHLCKKRRMEISFILLFIYALLNFTVQSVTPLGTLMATFTVNDSYISFATPMTLHLRLYSLYLVVGMVVNIIAIFAIHHVMRQRLNLE